MWLDEYQVDGLRFDSNVNIRNVYGNNNEGSTAMVMNSLFCVHCYSRVIYSLCPESFFIYLSDF